jgi:dephospho-CoA kinase
MRIIGITGGIGTGKTEVATLLKALGAQVIDADLVAHETYAPGTEGFSEVVAEFGDGVLTASGHVDRRRLADIVFGDPAALERLQEIVHPRTRAAVAGRLQSMREGRVEAAVLVAPLLVEAGWTEMVDEVWVTVAETDSVVGRVGRRDGLAPDAVRARIEVQASEAERLAYADAVIDNDGGLDELRTRVTELWNTRMRKDRSQDQ